MRLQNNKALAIARLLHLKAIPGYEDVELKLSEIVLIDDDVSNREATLRDDDFWSEAGGLGDYVNTHYDDPVNGTRMSAFLAQQVQQAKDKFGQIKERPWEHEFRVVGVLPRFVLIDRPKGREGPGGIGRTNRDSGDFDSLLQKVPWNNAGEAPLPEIAEARHVQIFF